MFLSRCMLNPFFLLKTLTAPAAYRLLSIQVSLLSSALTFCSFSSSQRTPCSRGLLSAVLWLAFFLGKCCSYNCQSAVARWHLPLQFGASFWEVARHRLDLVLLAEHALTYLSSKDSILPRIEHICRPSESKADCLRCKSS